jgi:hypothetical protein
MNWILFKNGILIYLIIHSILLILAGHIKLPRQPTYTFGNIIDGIVILIFIIICLIF